MTAAFLSVTDVNNHYNMSCGDSETESMGYYENSVDGDNSGHGFHPHHRFSGGNGYNSYSQYTYDNHVDNSTDVDDVNAATAMLALKHGPKIFNGVIRNG